MSDGINSMQYFTHRNGSSDFALKPVQSTITSNPAASDSASSVYGSSAKSIPTNMDIYLEDVKHQEFHVYRLHV